MESIQTIQVRAPTLSAVPVPMPVPVLRLCAVLGLCAVLRCRPPVRLVAGGAELVECVWADRWLAGGWKETFRETPKQESMGGDHRWHVAGERDGWRARRRVGGV